MLPLHHKLQGFIAFFNEKYFCLSVQEFLGTRLESRTSLLKCFRSFLQLLISYAWIATDIMPEIRNLKLLSLLSEPETSCKFDHAMFRHHGKLAKVCNYHNMYVCIRQTVAKYLRNNFTICHNKYFLNRSAFLVVLFYKTEVHTESVLQN